MIKSWSGVILALFGWFLVYRSISTGGIGLRGGTDVILFAEEPIQYCFFTGICFVIAIGGTYVAFTGNRG